MMDFQKVLTKLDQLEITAAPRGARGISFRMYSVEIFGDADWRIRDGLSNIIARGKTLEELYAWVGTPIQEQQNDAQ